MEDSKRVTQDNALISAKYTMTLNEKRLLLAAISKLDPTSKAWKDGKAEVTITVHEWVELFKTDRKYSYKQLREASAALYGRSVRIKGDHLNGKNLRWLQAEEYSQDKGMVTITFSGVILKYLTSLFDQFTSYDLLGVSGLKSVYSIRLYEIATQFKNTGWRQVQVNELRGMLGAEGFYPRWAELRRRAVDVAVKELNLKSDISIDYKIIKEGKEVVAVRLFVKPKDQLELEL